MTKRSSPPKTLEQAIKLAKAHLGQLVGDGRWLVFSSEELGRKRFDCESPNKVPKILRRHGLA